VVAKDEETSADIKVIKIYMQLLCSCIQCEGQFIVGISRELLSLFLWGGGRT
jgi:hypothetical protein